MALISNNIVYLNTSKQRTENFQILTKIVKFFMEFHLHGLHACFCSWKSLLEHLDQVSQRWAFFSIHKNGESASIFIFLTVMSLCCWLTIKCWFINLRSDSSSTLFFCNMSFFFSIAAGFFCSAFFHERGKKYNFTNNWRIINTRSF